MSTATIQSAGYARPPILEAVIGINFAQPIGDAGLGTIDKRFAKHYDAHQDHILQNLTIHTRIVANAKPVHSAQGQEVKGHRRSTPNMDEVAILMPDALTVAQLAPYPGWDKFFARFQRDYALYKRPRERRSVARIGLRYINRIDMPIVNNQVAHESYLGIYPQVPDTLGPLAGFSMTSSFTLEAIGCMANIATAPIPSPVLGHVSFVLDIDIFRDTDLPLANAALFELMEKMRNEKNRIFEACVTERSRREVFGYANA